MTVKYHRPKYAMAQKLRRGPGVAIPDAVRRAQANLEAMRGDLLGDLACKLDRLEANLAASSPAASETAPAYDLAEQLIAVAGACGLDRAAAAAHSLCELLDFMGPEAARDREPIIVHIRALRLLSQPDAVDEAAADKVLDGLEQVCARYKA